MKHTTLCVASLLGDIAIGSVLALACTTKTGDEMRSLVRDFLSDEINKWHSTCKEAMTSCECDKK